MSKLDRGGASLEHVFGDLCAADVDVVAGVLDLAHALPQHLHLPLQLEALAEVVAGEHDEPAVDLVLCFFSGYSVNSHLALLKQYCHSKLNLSTCSKVEQRFQGLNV